MNLWKELRIRWMYWRFRNITRNRQRLAARWASRRRARPAYQTASYRGGRGAPAIAWGRRSARSWIILIAAILAISVIQHYSQSTDLTFVADLGVLAAAYFIWLRLGGW